MSTAISVGSSSCPAPDLKVGPTDRSGSVKPAPPDLEVAATARTSPGLKVAPMGHREPHPSDFEDVTCYLCGSGEHDDFITAEDDLTGRPGRFRFVTCRACGLAYQNPRLTLARVADFYDDNYIAHRKRRDWGVLTPLFDRAMAKLDADKERLVASYCPLTSSTAVLDVGCGSGSFLQRLRRRHGVQAAGLDFKDLSSSPFLEGVAFHRGLFYEVDLEPARFDVVTMWHFLEHDYDPLRSLRTARRLLRPGGRLVVEVPRLDSRTFRWFGHRWPGLQAPQHTTLLDRAHLVAMTQAAGFEVVDYLPYGAFPAYFYLFTGAAFHLLRGRGLNLDRAMVPYFLGQLLLTPVLAFETRLNLAMQTVVCRRAA
jgi:SAM-dependent methyltransferase